MNMMNWLKSKIVSSTSINDEFKMNCPKCNSKLLPGPCGGVAQNWYCSNRRSCRQGFNYMMMTYPPDLINEIGEVKDDVYLLYTGENL